MSENETQTGRLILILGPSGVGKDTLIDGARTRYVDDRCVHFARRTITRPATAGSEDHRALTTDEFLVEEASGAFAVTWQANGLQYGLSKDLHDKIEKGVIVIANGSRGALTDIRAAFSDPVVVLVSVNQGELKRRLIARGRENGEEIEARLKRTQDLSLDLPDVVRIDNSGSPGKGIAALVAVIEEVVHCSV